MSLCMPEGGCVPLYARVWMCPSVFQRVDVSLCMTEGGCVPLSARGWLCPSVCQRVDVSLCTPEGGCEGRCLMGAELFKDLRSD